MISPTRRVAQSLATKAFASSSLLAASSAGKSERLFFARELAAESRLGVAGDLVAPDDHR